EPGILANSGAASVCSLELATRSREPSPSPRRSRQLRQRTVAVASYSGLLNRSTTSLVEEDSRRDRRDRPPHAATSFVTIALARTQRGTFRHTNEPRCVHLYE